MKILAVIPARKGSKGIPNKNTRLLCGKPLVFYAISNALKSTLITDVVVSTDSEEVAIIASQMGVAVHMRDSALATDTVTLDAVIFDAMHCSAAGNAVTWDYVVTLQPTSPTLCVDTLDNAIRHCVDSGLDTLISAVNRPHLAWVDDANGRKKPAYAKRKNRQELPYYYPETGAFLIARADIITADTRIGANIDVFELPDNEALDIDTFEDLLVAQQLLSAKKTAIYVNGNNKRGTGHIYRSMEVADMLYSKPDIYFDINQTQRKAFGETTHNLFGVDGFGELLDRLYQNNYNIVISDVLATTADYMIALRKSLPDAGLVNFEDDGEGADYADLVINELYGESNSPHIKAGERYYIAPKLFMLYNPIEIKQAVKHIFIGFGGADPQNYTERLLDIISQPQYADYNFTVVLGREKQNVISMLEFNKMPNIEVLHDISNMPQVMSGCDIAVTSRGRTCYELAILGIPTISMAQNKREEKHGFVCNDNGFHYLGLNPNDSEIITALDMLINMPQNERQERQAKLLSHDLHKGRGRVQNLIDSLF